MTRAYQVIIKQERKVEMTKTTEYLQDAVWHGLPVDVYREVFSIIKKDGG